MYDILSNSDYRVWWIVASSVNQARFFDPSQLKVFNASRRRSEYLFPERSLLALSSRIGTNRKGSKGADITRSASRLGPPASCALRSIALPDVLSAFEKRDSAAKGTIRGRMGSFDALPSAGFNLPRRWDSNVLSCPSEHRQARIRCGQIARVAIRSLPFRGMVTAWLDFFSFSVSWPRLRLRLASLQHRPRHRQGRRKRRFRTTARSATPIRRPVRPPATRCGRCRRTSSSRR